MLKASLLAALAVAVLLLVIPLPADARKKKSKAVSVGGDEDSIGCKACKRMVMALEQFVIPNFKDKMVRIGSREAGKTTAHLSWHVCSKWVISCLGVTGTHAGSAFCGSMKKNL